MDLLENLEKAKEVKPVATANGLPLYTFEGAGILMNDMLLKEKAGMKEIELGERSLNPDGTYSSSRSVAIAFNPNTYFDNRYKRTKKGQKTVYEVVTDWRAIQEQASGRVYTNNIIVFVIGQNDKELELIETKTISADDFINEYKKKLGIEAIKKISEAITKGMTSAVEEENELSFK